MLGAFVALRKESVDRNTNFYPVSLFDLPSLSARRAWIEIFCDVSLNYKEVVALRKESVDRNFVTAFDVLAVSAVALRKESVDRNIKLMPLIRFYPGRSPQGERG